MEVIGFQPVVQVRAALAAESTLGPVGRFKDAGGAPFDHWWLAAMHHQQWASGPLAAHAAVAGADLGVVDGDLEAGGAAQAGAVFFQGHDWLLERRMGQQV